MTLNDENGKYLLSFYGNSLALGFKGDNDFIRRSFNWAHNHEVTKGSLHWFYGDGGKLAYVLIKSREDIVSGFARQFRAEIIMNHEIPSLRDEFDPENGESILEYDEKKIDKLAQKRAEEFFAERVELENFLSRIPMSLAPVYEYHAPKRKSAWRTSSSYEKKSG